MLVCGALREFKKSIKKYVGTTGLGIKKVTNILLNKENLAFISFLRFKYQKVL